MRLQIQISDDDYDKIAAQSAQLGGKASPEEVAAAILTHFSSVRVTDRIVVVDSRARDRLENLLPSGGSLRDAADLVARVDRLARIEVGEVRIPFTIGELEELGYRARGQGRPIADLIAEAVAAWHDQFFNWPDTRTCAECSRTIRGGKVEVPAPPPSPPPAPTPPPALPLVDIAGKVAVERAIPAQAQRLPPAPVGGAMKPPIG